MGVIFKKAVQVGLLLVLWGTGSSLAHATKYAGEPFNLGFGARPLGRGAAFVAAPGDATSPYWNPAALATVTTPQIAAMHAETFGSLLNHDVIAVAWPSTETRRFAVGGLFYYLGGGGINITAFDSTTNRPYVLRTESHGDYLAGVSIGYAVRRNVHLGATGKFIYRSVAAENAYGLGLDLGAQWIVHPRATLAVKLADASGTYLSYNTGTTETIVPHADIGGEIHFPYREWDFVAAAQAETYFENRRGGSQIYAGSVSADLHFGLEVGYREMVYGRLGSDIGHLTAGLGVRIWQFDIDAAFLDHDEFETTYRLSLAYRFR